MVINRCLASLFDNIEDVFLKFYQEKSVFWIHYVQLGANMNFLFFLTEMKLPYPIFTLPDFEWPNQKKEYIL